MVQLGDISKIILYISVTVHHSLSVSHLNIRCIPLAAPPGAHDARESSIWMVKFILITVQKEGSEGLLI